jgi:hypothetical protein
MVEPPYLIAYELGGAELSTRQQAYWEQLEAAERQKLVKGIILECWFTITVKRDVCPTCKGAAEINDATRAAYQIDRADIDCRGTGYHRSIEAR